MLPRSDQTLPGDSQVVFVPASPTDDRRDVALEIHHTQDGGEPVGLAFTDLDKLVGSLGDCQPWARLPMLNYVALLLAHGVGRVQVDPVLPSDLRPWDSTRLAAYLGEPR